MMRISYLALALCLLSPVTGVSVASAGSPGSKVILFLGDSLTAGYGLDPSQAFPALIQEKINSRHWKFSVINAGQSGETSAGGLRRIEWLLQRKIDVLILELGANDGLRGIDVEVTRRNLQAIVDRTKEKYPKVRVVLVGMQVPPNLGPDYASRFRSIFFSLARKNQILIIPFLLEGVGGVPSLNLHDGMHPTSEGHKILAKNVWNVLEPLLRSLR